MNISDYIPASYIPAIITASVALIAAVLAQVLNNWLTHRRESKKYLKEVYGNFISKFFADIITYAYVNATPGKGHETKGEVDISAVLEEMFKLIHYGDKHLQALHLEYNTWRYMEDNKGDMKEIIQFKICYYFLLYSKEILGKINFPLEATIYHTLNHSIKEFGYLYVCANLKGINETINDITSIRFFGLVSLKNLSLKQIHEVVTSDNFEIQEQLIKEIDEEIARTNIQ